MLKAHEFLEKKLNVPITELRWPGHWLSRGWKEAVDSHAVREDYINHFGYAIPTKRALDTIALHSPILEIGAGAGYWAYELRRLGATVVATDSYHKEWAHRWINAPKLDAVAAVRLYPRHTLLIVWPDHSTAWPAAALAEHTGDHVFYVGEGPEGCTGDDRFHDLLRERFDRKETIAIPQFYGMHDRLYHYTRKQGVK